MTIKVLVVDDSAVIRRIVCDVLERDPDLQVVGTASNGRIALDRIERLSPDVITLDIEMPEMDGLETLRELRARRIRTPVIMFSTLTERHASATFEALALGASDYVTKPSNVGSAALAIERVRQDLIPRVKAFARRRTLSSAARPQAKAATPLHATRASAGRRVGIVAIGTSTGGPNALEAVFRALPVDIAVPVVVVQHMPPVFTKILADRLTAKTAWQVYEADHGMRLEPGHAYIAPGDHHMVVSRSSAGGRIEINQQPPENSCRPAVDVLFRSVASSYGAATLALVMTGMGQDGHKGSEQIVAAGGEVFAQDEATSVVWGMPGHIARNGLATQILPLDQIARAIDQRVRRSALTAPRPSMTRVSR